MDDAHNATLAVAYRGLAYTVAGRALYRAALLKHDRQYCKACSKRISLNGKDKMEQSW